MTDAYGRTVRQDGNVFTVTGDAEVFTVTAPTLQDALTTINAMAPVGYVPPGE